MDIAEKITQQETQTLQYERGQALKILEAVKSGRGARIYVPSTDERRMLDTQGYYIVTPLLSEAQRDMIEGLIERYMQACISDIDKIIGDTEAEE